jgi:hypothetical protein
MVLLTSTTSKLVGHKAFCCGSTSNACQQGTYSQLLPGGTSSASFDNHLHHDVQCLKSVLWLFQEKNDR